MNPSYTILYFIVVLFSIFLGFAVAIKITRNLFHRKSYNTENAFELLKAERPEEWNEVRILNPNWIPNLQNIELRSLSLVSVNFRDANLEGAYFIGSKLDGSVFDRARLVKADFTNSSLVDVSFNESDLSEAKFVGATLSGVSLVDANLDRANLPSVPVDMNKGERIEKDMKEIIRHLSEKPSDIFELSPREFEEIVASLFENMGYEVAKTPASRDSGYDLRVVKHDPALGEVQMLVEAKKYSPDRKIGVSPLRALSGVTMANNAASGILVTPNQLTKGAEELTKEIKWIKVADGKMFQNWIDNAAKSVKSKK